MRRLNRMTCVVLRLRAIALSGVLTVAIVGAGCTSSISCTAEARFSLAVVVLDLKGHSVCNASVTTTDGEFASPLQPVGCVYTGISERAGTYTVTARLGSRSAQRTGIKVSKDKCHVHPEDVILVLS